MKHRINLLLLTLAIGNEVCAQSMPIDTSTWDINARAFVIEKYQGEQAIYLQGGTMTLKDVAFLNGVIEFDIMLKQEQAFPGVNFRVQEDGNSEEFYVRPHLPGKPDANQAAASIKNITPWQLYFGPRYSFPYEYSYDDWTHIRLLVNGSRAQVFLDHSKEPQLSWNLFHEPKAGSVILRGGNQSGFHIANIKVTQASPELKNFAPVAREPIPNLISSWEVSDMFAEKELEETANLAKLIAERRWKGSIEVEEGTAANISRIQNLFDGSEGNTVFARIIINSNKNQLKLLEFGYSDRVVAILNGKPIYWGNNRWRSRDYRYLGTIGLFDGIYLDLKKGENELLMAVSEDFGGWLVTGRFKDERGISIQ